MSKIVYDGDGAVFGRIASVIAKDLLKGNDVDLINCEKMVISGDKKLLAKKILAKREMGSGGSMKGPKYPRTNEKLVKRMIRGMLPWDRMKGRDAYRKLKCYDSVSSAQLDVSGDVVKLKHQMPRKFASVKEIVGLLR
jgi:large subunit ribosomal protein L13